MTNETAGFVLDQLQTQRDKIDAEIRWLRDQDQLRAFSDSRSSGYQRQAVAAEGEKSTGQVSSWNMSEVASEILQGVPKHDIQDCRQDAVDLALSALLKAVKNRVDEEQDVARKLKDQENERILRSTEGTIKTLKELYERCPKEFRGSHRFGVMCDRYRGHGYVAYFPIYFDSRVWKCIGLTANGIEDKGISLQDGSTYKYIG